MNRRLLVAIFTAGPAIAIIASQIASAQYAAQVISYDGGITAAPGFTNPAVAMGAPERFSGEGVFPVVVSPFSPPFLNSELVSIGEGGHLTLRLSNYAIPQVGEPEIGLFNNVGIIDTAYPNGMAGSPISSFGMNMATIQVSENGVSWVELPNAFLNVPTNGFTDSTDPYSSTPGSLPSDFQQPFIGTLQDFAGLKYSDAGRPDILELLAGSGGGKWIDISESGLQRVGFIRLGIFSPFDPIDITLELDAVSVSHAALGPLTVPEPAAVMLAASAILAWQLRPRGGSAARRVQGPTTRRSLAP